MDICQQNDSTTLVNLCLHYKFILDRRCQFSSQTLVICGKFWFSAFIWRKLRLRLTEYSQVLTVRLFFKKRVVSGFNASTAVILMLSSRGLAWWWKKENFRRFRIGGITCWRVVPNARIIGRIIGRDSRSHFETSQSHGNDSEARKWEVLPHPPYSLDVAPSNYQFFRSMAHGLAHQHFRSYEEVKKWIDSWIASKDASFFRDGIRQLPERWKQVVASNGQYFESWIDKHFIWIKSQILE